MDNVIIIGFFEEDILNYLPKKQRFLGGGGFATALWFAYRGIPIKFYTCCGINPTIDEFYKRIGNNRKNLDSLSISCLNKSNNINTTKIHIHRENTNEYKWIITNIDCWQEIIAEDKQLKLSFPQEKQTLIYCKLPIKFLKVLEKQLPEKIVYAINITGKYFLNDIKQSKANLVFLNKEELLNATQKNFSKSFLLIPKLGKDFVITLGESGLIYYSSALQTWYQFPAFKMTSIKDTLGCGDALVGGFLSAEYEGKTIKEKLAAGVIASALITQTFGALPPISLTNIKNKRNFEEVVNIIKDKVSIVDSYEEILAKIEIKINPDEIRSMRILLKNTSKKCKYWNYI